MASFTADSKLQSYNALRELVLKVERGEVEIIDMSITQEAPETRDFYDMGDGNMGRRMVVRRGGLTVEMKLALTGRLSEPGYIDREAATRDEAGRLRGTVGVPRDKPYSQMNREEIREAADMLLAERLAIKEMRVAIDPIKEPQEPVDPLRYGARKLDID